MGQERMSGLAPMHIHYDIQLYVDVNISIDLLEFILDVWHCMKKT